MEHCPSYRGSRGTFLLILNPLNAELNSICHLLTLLGSHHILHVSRVRVKMTLLGSHHILHVSRVRVKVNTKYGSVKLSVPAVLPLDKHPKNFF